VSWQPLIRHKSGGTRRGQLNCECDCAPRRSAQTSTQNNYIQRRRADKRPAFDALCRDATKRQFDMVMAWSVDRLGRSLKDLVAFLSELHALRIDLFLHQQGLDTRTPAGKAMFQMMGVFAEFERAIIQERVRAGLARARSEGKQLGRPRIAPELEKRIRKALATPGRPGVRVIAKRFCVDPGTVQRISRPFEGDAGAVVV
jgi:DNA invertase Pin-like site-specific DNA recombinase